jgi:hypothetical protein
MAILRLWSVFKHSQSAASSFDFTYWYPEVLIISCLEVDFAIMCASMPIFWPTVVANWSHIFVTKEVRVSHHERLDSVNWELGRVGSVRSRDSIEWLKRVATGEGEGEAQYKGFDAKTGRDARMGVMQVEVQPYRQEIRRL